MKWVAGAGGGGRGLEVRKKREGRGSCWGLGYREEGDREPCGTCGVRRAEGLRGLMGRAEHRGPELGSFQRIGRETMERGGLWCERVCGTGFRELRAGSKRMK